MTPLPDSFPSPAHLPFNSHSLRGRFEPGTPDADPTGTEGRLVLLRGVELLAAGPTDELRLPRGPLEEVSGEASPAPLYLGTWDGEPCRALAWPRERPLPDGLSAQSLLAAEPNLPISLLTLAGRPARSCTGRKTAASAPAAVASRSDCRNSGGRNAPPAPTATTPTSIPAPSFLCGGRGRCCSPARPVAERRYSLVAGFSISASAWRRAVDREVEEETGVRVERHPLRGQPGLALPEPAHGRFTAEYTGGEVRVEEKELEDARWFRVGTARLAAAAEHRPLHPRPLPGKMKKPPGGDRRKRKFTFFRGYQPTLEEVTAQSIARELCSIRGERGTGRPGLRDRGRCDGAGMGVDPFCRASSASAAAPKTCAGEASHEGQGAVGQGEGAGAARRPPACWLPRNGPPHPRYRPGRRGWWAGWSRCSRPGRPPRRRLPPPGLIRPTISLPTSRGALAPGHQHGADQQVGAEHLVLDILGVRDQACGCGCA